MIDGLSAIRGETFGNQVKRTRVPRSSGKKVKEVWCHMHGSSHICVDIHISNLTYMRHFAMCLGPLESGVR